MGKKKKKRNRSRSDDFIFANLPESAAPRGVFRDKEALYEAQYLARKQARLEGRGLELSARQGGVENWELTKLKRELDRSVSRGAKKKCCHSSPRCMRCPYVIAQLQRIDAAQLDEDSFRRALRRIRSA